MSVHLGIDEATDVVSAVGPLKLTVAFDLGVFKLATIDVVLVLSCHTIVAAALHELTPLLESFSIDFLTLTEGACDFDLTKFELFDSLSPHLVSDPISVVLGPI